MALRKARKPREADEVSAVVIAFPVVARRDLASSAKLPFTVIPVHPSEHVSSRAAPKPANQNDRPALPLPPRGRFWEAAIAFSLIAHTALFAAMWERNNHDLERAAGAAAAASDGAVVIPIEVVVTAALPSAPTPVEATVPEEKQVAPSVPHEQQDTEKTEKAETAPPPKSDEAPEVVREAKETKETPKPEKQKQKEKKKHSPTPRTAAANPSQAAGARAQGRAGAGGRRNDAGGSANTSSYQAQVLAHLQRYKSYPEAAKSSGVRGIATVRFALSASGAVISASLARGSGASILDQAAVAMVRRASPFPPIPSSLGRSRMDFSAPIRFDLR